MLVYKKKSFVSKKSRIFPFSRFTNSNLDDNSYVGLFAFINNTEIGKYCSISMNFKSGLGQHPTNFISTSPVFYSKKYAIKNSLASDEVSFQEYAKVTIGNDVWIGADVIVMDGVVIGDGAIIASKAVVVKDVPNYAIVGGVPGKVLKYRFSDEIITELEKLQWWNWGKEKLEKNKSFFTQETTLESIQKLIENNARPSKV